MRMKHLCFDYTLSFVAGLKALYVPVWLLFLCCLFFIELVNANQRRDVLNFLPDDKMSVRQEGAWSLVRVLWAQTACGQHFTLHFTVIPIINGPVEEVQILFSKSGEKSFLNILRKLRQRKWVCFQNHGTDERTSDCYLCAAKFTESLLQTLAPPQYP